MLALRNSNRMAWPMADWFNDSFFEMKKSDFSKFEVDTFEDEDKYILKANVPGVERDDLNISLENDIISISYDLKDEWKDESLCIRERKIGHFERSFRLADKADENSIEAVLKDGILTVTIDKAEESKPKRIEIKTE